MPVLTTRQLELCRVMAEMVDIDTLNDNLDREGIAETDLDEMDLLAHVLREG